MSVLDFSIANAYQINSSVSKAEILSNTFLAPKVAVVGLGYVGLPTALHFLEAGAQVIGFDISSQRICDVRNHTAELIPADAKLLGKFLPIGDKESNFQLTTESSRISEAHVVFICVPTPVDRGLSPNLSQLREACSSVVAEARVGQVIILVSTTYVGCTYDLLVRPLTEAGFRVGEDIFVAFSPERINPGDSDNQQPSIPRVLGAATSMCLKKSEVFIKMCSESVHLMSSLEAAEMSKLLENTFRAVNVAWINEMAAVAAHSGLDVNEVINGAATKPFGFTKFTPGPGIGGHCIPCDPYYLLAGVPEHLVPLTSATMKAVQSRPHTGSLRAIDMLTAEGIGPRFARVIVVGVSYKPDVQDVRESPALEILRELHELGVNIGFFDPLVANVTVSGKTFSGVNQCDLATADLVIWHTPHSIFKADDLLTGVKLVLDLSYRLDVKDTRIHRLEVSSLAENFIRGRLGGA